MLRSSGGDLPLQARLTDDGTIHVEWTAPPGAASYRVRVVTSTAETLISDEVTEATVTLEPSDLESRAADETLFVSVRAFDAAGFALASSELLELPRRR